MDRSAVLVGFAAPCCPPLFWCLTLVVLAQELMTQKDKLEEEIGVLAGVLNSPTPDGGPPAGEKGGFVDAEGFPRADIDIYAGVSSTHPPPQY